MLRPQWFHSWLRHAAVAATAASSWGQAAKAEIEGAARVTTTSIAQTQAEDTKPKPSERSFLEGQAFRCYAGDTGRPLPWTSVKQQIHQAAQAGAADAEGGEVWLLGEVHDDPVAHILELALWQAACDAAGPFAAQQPQRQLVLSLEMFETDVQGVMDEWLVGLLRDRDLLVDGRAWPNYPQDYHPLVQLARQRGLPVVCANAPRRYVSLVGKRGVAALAGLPPASQALLPPLPVRPASERYRRRINQIMAAARGDALTKEVLPAQPPAAGQAPTAVHSDPPAAPATPWSARPPPAAGTVGSAGRAHGGPLASRSRSDTPGPGPPPSAQHATAAPQAAAPPGPGQGKECPWVGLNLSSNFYDAQNLWDATMAHSIGQALRRHRWPSADATASADPAAGAAHGGKWPLVLHVCGKAHCEGGLGIAEHLPHYGVARVKIITLLPARTVHMSPDELAQEGLLGQADVLVLTDGKLPRSYESMHPA